MCPTDFHRITNHAIFDAQLLKKIVTIINLDLAKSVFNEILVYLLNFSHILELMCRSLSDFCMIS